MSVSQIFRTDFRSLLYNRTGALGTCIPLRPCETKVHMTMHWSFGIEEGVHVGGVPRLISASRCNLLTDPYLPHCKSLESVNHCKRFVSYMICIWPNGVWWCRCRVTNKFFTPPMGSHKFLTTDYEIFGTPNKRRHEYMTIRGLPYWQDLWITWYVYDLTMGDISIRDQCTWHGPSPQMSEVLNWKFQNITILI